MEENVHVPVLLDEVLNYLVPPRENALLIDGTAGEGGHIKAFLEKYSGLKITGIDRDKEILSRASLKLADYIEDGRLKLLVSHSLDYFSSCENPEADLILLDLGVSRFHYELSGRGFSFSKDEPLDMRLSKDCAFSAGNILADYRENEIADMLYENGGERASRRIARFICEERRKSPVTTTARLASIIHRAIGARSGNIDSATRTFAALRIEVNSELKSLEALLRAAFCALKTGGRLGVISFHSAEDRIVKNVFRELTKDKPESFEQNAPKIKSDDFLETSVSKKYLGRLVVKKPVVPGAGELENNPPSRSAKLRVIEKIAAG